MSKWVDTAIRPVPERSHMLKTWPTNAGPPFPVVLSPEILTDDGKPDPESERMFTMSLSGQLKRRIREGQRGEDSWNWAADKRE